MALEHYHPQFVQCILTWHCINVVDAIFLPPLKQFLWIAFLWNSQQIKDQCHIFPFFLIHLLYFPPPFYPPPPPLLPSLNSTHYRSYHWAGNGHSQWGGDRHEGREGVCGGHHHATYGWWDGCHDDRRFIHNIHARYVNMCNILLWYVWTRNL